MGIQEALAEASGLQIRLQSLSPLHPAGSPPCLDFLCLLEHQSVKQTNKQGKLPRGGGDLFGSKDGLIGLL